MRLRAFVEGPGGRDRRPARLVVELAGAGRAGLDCAIHFAKAYNTEVAVADFDLVDGPVAPLVR